MSVQEIMSSQTQIPKESNAVPVSSEAANVTPPPHQLTVDDFKREFAAKNGCVFFMLRGISKLSGIEISAYRRANMFYDYLGVEVTLISTSYYNNLTKRCDACGVKARVLNMYDYFQEIDRDKEQPREAVIDFIQDDWKIERLERIWRAHRQDGTLAMYCDFSPKDKRINYINFFNKKVKKIRRDTYDALGFLSRRQELEAGANRPTEVFYYRPDGTVAVHETYKLINGKNTLTLIELINRDDVVTKSFPKIDDALSYWLMQLLSDATKNYFLIGDRTPEWHKTYAAIKSAGLNNVKVLHQLHNIHVGGELNPFTSFTKSRYKYLTDKSIKSDVIISLTTRQRDDIIKRYKLDNVITLPHSVAAVPPMTDVELDPFKIIQVGRIVEEKGHAKAVEAMKIVLKKVPQATLHFFGTGSLQKDIQKLIDENNLGNSIKFEGFSNNMPAEFASSAMSILPSTYEGFPLVIQESMQQGCPMVAFDCNYGPADGIEDGVNGYLVPVDDIEAMADRIIKILTEPGLRERLSANCAKSVEKFAPEVVAKQWANLFLKLMNSESIV